MSDKHYFAHESAYIDEGCVIGEGTKVWHFSHIMKNCTLGKNCNIGQNVVICPDITLGDRVKIQNNVTLFTGVTCEDDVFLSPGVMFTNIDVPRSFLNKKNQHAKTLVKKGATIGAHAVIIGGNTLGEYCFVGAKSLVTKPVLPYAMVYGHPAKQMGWVSEYGEFLDFNDANIAECPESKDTYKLSEFGVKKV